MDNPEPPKPAGTYIDLREELSQGDIIPDIPWGIVEDPLLVSTPKGGTWDQSRGSSFYSTPQLCTDPKKAFQKPYRLLVPVRRGPVMLLWEDCQIDKFKELGRDPAKWFAAVAPIKSAGHLSPEARTAIVKMEVHRSFPLPTNPDAGLTDSLHYVDLRYVWPVKQTLLKKRVASISEDARQALRRQLFLFFSQRRIVDPVTCPKCGTHIETTVPAHGEPAAVGSSEGD